MQHQLASFRTTDELTLFYQSWLPDDPRASLILSHGYAEHSARYKAFAEYLASQDIGVYALDHRGHGRSEGERFNVRVFREYVNDLARFTDLVREQEPQVPRFLFGHSVGGAVAAQFVVEHPLKVAGLVLSAPFLKSAVQVPPVLNALSGIVARVMPGLPTLKLDADLISRDEAEVAAYKNDPLVYTGGTKARLGVEMTNAGPYILARAESIVLPLLVLHGGADQIADPAGSRALHAAAASNDKGLKLYDDFYHEILNDLGREQVYADIADWLNARLG